MVAKHASANHVPTALVHRVIMRESEYNPELIGHGDRAMHYYAAGYYEIAKRRREFAEGQRKDADSDAPPALNADALRNARQSMR